MSAIIALVLFVVVAILAVTFLSAVIHLLFSPWILLVALGVFAWVKLRPRRTRTNSPGPLPAPGVRTAPPPGGPSGPPGGSFLDNQETRAIIARGR